LLFITRPEHSRPSPKAQGESQGQRVPRPKDLALRPRPRPRSRRWGTDGRLTSAARELGRDALSSESGVWAGD